MVNLFLGVVPENLRSSYEQEELGHEQVLPAACSISKTCLVSPRCAHSIPRWFEKDEKIQLAGKSRSVS